jgi:NAD(P)H-quinone oxidoreductase subunit 5
MLEHVPLSTIFGVVVIASPMCLMGVLGLCSLLDRPLPERSIIRFAQTAIVAGLVAAIGVLVLMLVQGTRHVPIELGHWVAIEHFHFSVKLVFDRLSVPFVILTFLLCGTVSAFAAKYMHREPGFSRFFVLLAMFVLGMVVASLAGTIETLFAGWELVGMSSALLVAFFHERPAPPRNGLRVWSVYRISDAALLVAAVVLHHLTGEGDFDKLMGLTGSERSWPFCVASLPEQQALIVGLLLLVAAAGKSALIPFSGWLPRAMEGPTPSSAVFYGALSVHLGAYLLLRISPILELSPWLWGAVMILGLATALFAALAARVQTDIKSALSFASLTQVGIIVAEVGLASSWQPLHVLRYVALAHLIGHACLRTLQFLRAPTLLHDYHTLENAIGGHLPSSAGAEQRWLPEGLRHWAYRFAFERGYLDTLLVDYIARPFLQVFQWCDALERRWTDFLSRGQSRESDRVSPSATVLDDLS